MIRLGVIGSTRGTNLEAIFKAINEKKLPASVQVVLSNKPDAFILKRAIQYDVPAVFVNPEGLTRESYDREMTNYLWQYNVDLIVLIGYMRILSPAFLMEWGHRVINIHPSLLPAFAGKMDLDVHREVLTSNMKETGCTVHFVTEEVDAGPVVLQKSCKVLDDDSPESLKARVQALEGEALVEAILAISKQFHR